MKYGFTVPIRGPLATPEMITIMAKKGDYLGYDALFKGDHIVIPRRIASPYPYTQGGEFPGGPRGGTLDMITLLAYLAAQTRAIRLVTSVIIVPFRNPLEAAKALASLDVLSQGRLVVGVGVGWLKEEFDILGLPPFEERGAVTDEYIRAFKELWTSDDPSFEGKYCRFENISFMPKPLQKPHPPIWVGGESRPALRRTAELADGWYPWGSNPTYPMGTAQQLAAGIERMKSYARSFGRDPSEIEIIYKPNQFELKKNSGQASSGNNRPSFVGTADQIASDIKQYEQIGVGMLVLDFLAETEDMDLVQGRMEDFANQVWPKV